MSRKALTACTMPCVPAQIRTEPAQIRTGLQTAYHQRGSLSGMFERTPAAAPLVRQRATCSLSRPRLATSPPGRGRLSDRKNGRQVTTGLVFCGRAAIILSSPRSSAAAAGRSDRPGPALGIPLTRRGVDAQSGATGATPSPILVQPSSGAVPAEKAMALGP